VKNSADREGAFSQGLEKPTTERADQIMSKNRANPLLMEVRQALARTGARLKKSKRVRVSPRINRGGGGINPPGDHGKKRLKGETDPDANATS